MRGHLKSRMNGINVITFKEVWELGTQLCPTSTSLEKGNATVWLKSLVESFGCNLQSTRFFSILTTALYEL